MDTHSSPYSVNMRIRGHQDMSVSPNQLLLNGKVLLTNSLPNGNNHHSSQISQHGFPFRMLPNIADGYPIPILPNLNFLPEKTGRIGINDMMCSPSTPVPLDKNKRIQDRLSREVVDLVDGSETDGNLQRKEIGMWQPSTEKLVGLFSSEPVMSSQLVYSRPQEGEMNVAVPSEGVSLQQVETGKHGKRGNQGIDLNKTPEQKPRRKKHRPKVIKEGKSAKTPKPVTPKPVTPKPPRNNENPSGKRKYVRKKKVLNSSDSPLCPSLEIVDPDSGSGTKPVRRCLNFDSEEPLVTDGRMGSSWMFAQNAEVQARDACISGPITSQSVKPAVSFVQGCEVVADNSPERITLNINSSKNQFPCEYIRAPETPAPLCQPSRRETMIMDHMLNGYIRVAKNAPPPPQPSRREIIHENLKEFARKNYIQIAGNSIRSQQTGQRSQLDSNNISDVLLRGIKRYHNLCDEDHVSTHVNSSHAYNGVSESHHSSRHGPYTSQVHKKMRAEEPNELRSNASSVTCSPSSTWEQCLVMPNNCEVLTSADAQRPMTSSWMVSKNCEEFTFADAQRIMAFEKLRASEHMLSFAQKVQTNKMIKEPARANDLNCLIATKGCNDLSSIVKSSRFSDTNCSQLSTLDEVSRCNASRGNEIRGPHACIESPAVNNRAKMNSKNCTEKEQIHLVKPKSSKTKQTRLQEQEAASCSYGPSHGKKSLQVTASASGNFKDKNTRFPLSSLQDCQSGSNFKESLRGISSSGAIVPYGDPVDDIVRKMKRLNINGGHEIVRAEPQNALVPYGGGGGMVVPYEGPFDLMKKRRPRPKVDLDPESNRVWRLLMGKETSDEGKDMDKEKWWEEERRIFRGRVDSFIARMHLVQGDRRFSRWKGSVVDSVVGVFLTQNVSDHLSSSAFMALAARFPLRQKDNNSEPNAERISGFTEQQDGCIIAFDGSIKRDGRLLGQELCPRDSFVIPEAEHMAEKEIADSNCPVGSNADGSVVGYSEGIRLDIHERELVIGHESPNSRTDTPVTVTESTSVAEAEDRRSMEDVASSQNSVVSSQNSSEYPVQTAEHIKLSPLSNFDAEGLVKGRMCNGLDNSTSFLELLQMAETTRFRELYSHGNGTISSTECPPTYISNSHPHDVHHDFMGVSCAPSPSNHLQNSLKAIVSRNCGPEDSSTEAMGQHDFTGVSYATSPSYHLHNSYSRLKGIGKVLREEIGFQLPSSALVINTTNNIKMVGRQSCPSAEHSTEAMGQHDFTGVPCATSPSYSLHNISNSRLKTLGGVNEEREESSSHLPSTTSGTNVTDKIKIRGGICGLSEQNLTEVMGQQMPLCTSRTAPVLDTYAPISKHSVQPLVCSETAVQVENLQEEITTSSGKSMPHPCRHLQGEQTIKFQEKEKGVEFQVESTVRAQAQVQSGRIRQTCSNSHNNFKETFEIVEVVEPKAKDEAYNSQNVSVATANSVSKAKKVKAETEKKKAYDWDNLRKQACHSGVKRERNSDSMDSVDWEAVRCADESEISQAIRERGMNNMLAERIKEFLNRLVKDHGNIDLEWLRDVPPDKAKDYLLSIRGLGLKSVECVRLLTLHHLAFPVDTNVGRICVRLGWVPLQPLPESLQLHLLEMYPVLETIQKYLWPRLCKLDQRTLYELHYQLITFGKVFCTKSKPNCNACPMRGECKHFASAFASARLALPGPEEKGLVNSAIPISSEPRHTPVLNPIPLPRLEESTLSQVAVFNNCEPIIEEPATPEPEFIENSASAIEDAFYEDPDEIPTIKLNLEEFTQNLQNYMQENNMELQDGDMSKALVSITPEAASIPMPKLKNVSRLRTEHQVYELPDSHPLLEGLEQREPDDPSSYLLAIWSPGETAQSTEPPKVSCNSQDTGKLCDTKTCFACNSIREAQSQIVRGTILIPCRTAMRGSFPLNGTYFQVNEVFADHDSSLNPIDVSREWIWNLPRRTVYFGTSIPSIFKGLTTEGIQHCFWRGLVCVRGFDRTTRAPRPLYARLHFPASKTIRNRKAAAAARAEEQAM